MSQRRNRQYSPLSGWLFMLRKFGLRRTVWYWREGRRRGWMTRAQAEAFFESEIRGLRKDA